MLQRKPMNNASKSGVDRHVPTSPISAQRHRSCPSSCEAAVSRAVPLKGRLQIRQIIPRLTETPGDLRSPGGHSPRTKGDPPSKNEIPTKAFANAGMFKDSIIKLGGVSQLQPKTRLMMAAKSLVYWWVK